VFFSSKYGKISLVDKGGRTLKSKRGRLIPFARMELTFYISEKDTSGYISEVDILELYDFAQDGTLGRLAYASAVCELLHMLLPEEEPQQEMYQYFVTYLTYINTADKRTVPSLFLAYFLRLLSHLGYHPSLAYCVISGRPVTELLSEEGQISFSPERGGVVSAACQKSGEYYISLSHEATELLIALQGASLSEAAALVIDYQTALLLIEALSRFLSYQAGLKSSLNSLEFLDKLRKSQFR
jgi:DNA repair protein RecO